jgi:cobalt-zinc-cadmium efflux system outer membrane protein
MRWFSLVIAGALAASPLMAEEPAWKQRLEEAVSRAVSQNPSVAEMESRVQAARHRVGQASALPDPELEITAQDVPPSDFSFTRDDFTMTKVTARQTFPGAGKRPTREKVADAALAATEALHVEHLSRVAADVADAFFAVADVDAQSEILGASRQRFERVAASASERYRLGKGLQTDVLRANLEVTALEDKKIGLAGERRMLAARLNALQALPPETPIAPIPLPDDDPSTPSSADLIGTAETKSPTVAVAEAQIRQASEDLELARLERRPDVMAMAYYANRASFEDFVGASLAVNLPFFQPKRLREREAEREADLSGARANLEMQRNEIRRGIAEAYASLERAREQAALYRGSILPQAETNAKAAQESYAVGQIDFLTYVRAALDLDAYASELAARRVRAWRAVAALQAASGLPLIPGTPGMGETHVEN